MKSFIITLGIIAMSVVAASAQQATATAQPADMPADKQAEMQAWEAYMTPSAVHKMIAKSDGGWKVETTIWMDLTSAPIKSTGTCTNRMMLGGRYQESRFEGTMMGKPYEGRGTLAYDNAKKVFINTWIDNMGTGLMTLTGTWDDATKSINFSGTMVDPSSGKDLPVREVFIMKGADSQVLQMYMNVAGKEVKTMEINFSRVTKKD